MDARLPLVVIARQDNWLLRLLESHDGIGLDLIVVRRQIASLGVVVNGLQIHAVLQTQLLLQLKRHAQLLQVVVRTITLLGPISGFDRVTALTHRAVLHRILNPVAATRISRLRTEAEMILLE